MFKNMRLVILFDMFLNTSFKMTTGFANIARTAYSFAFEYLCIAWHIFPLIPLSTINYKSTSVNNSNFIPIFFKCTYQASLGADRNEAESL